MQESYVIFEEGILPSMGKMYAGGDFNPEFKIRSMTTEEEMRRLSHSDKPLKVICDIIDSCIIDNHFGVSSYDMCLGDYQYLLNKLRIATYGNSYKQFSICPICGSKVEKVFDLDSIGVSKYSDDMSSLFSLVLPKTGKNITLKFQTPRMIDSLEIKKKEFIKKAPNAPDPTLIFSLMAMVDTVDGEKLDVVKLEDFLRKLPMADTNKIIKRADRIVRSVGLDMEIGFDCEVCGNNFRSSFRVTNDFYGPSDDE